MSGGPFAGLGSVLRELRADRRLTQAQLGERAGVTKAMLSLYEGERQRPQLDTLGKLLDALGVSLGQLAARLEGGGSDRQQPRPGLLILVGKLRAVDALEDVVVALEAMPE